jgi:hypothetical protein
MLSQAMSIEQIRTQAPSVFATTPWAGMSEKYRFVPTIEVVNEMIAKGFVPVSAAQARCRIEGKGEFTRHVLRFRTQESMNALAQRHTPGVHTFINDGPVVPELVLLNSHDGTSAYKLMLGMFRMICSNGLIVCSSMIEEVRARHSGREGLVNEVIEGSFKIIENAPVAMKQVNEWQQRELTPAQQLAYATAALELRDTTVKPDATRLLDARRSSDKGNDVWTTFNRVQENMIRGGIGTMHTNTAGRRTWRHTRAVKSVNEDTKLNRALWRLTEELAKAA